MGEAVEGRICTLPTVLQSPADTRNPVMDFALYEMSQHTEGAERPSPRPRVAGLAASSEAKRVSCPASPLGVPGCPRPIVRQKIPCPVFAEWGFGPSAWLTQQGSSLRHRWPRCCFRIRLVADEPAWRRISATSPPPRDPVNLTPCRYPQAAAQRIHLGRNRPRRPLPPQLHPPLRKERAKRKLQLT